LKHTDTRRRINVDFYNAPEFKAWRRKRRWLDTCLAVRVILVTAAIGSAVAGLLAAMGRALS
jgi:hypothetical protein